MSSFVYFAVTKVRSVSRAEFPEIFDRLVTATSLYRGPQSIEGEMVDGCFVMEMDDERSRAAFVGGEGMTWEKVEEGGLVWWVGMWNDDPPAPEDLMRVDALGGKGVVLGDGRAWEFKQLMYWTQGETLLPREMGSFRRTAAGITATRFRPQVQYRYLSELGKSVWTLLQGGPKSFAEQDQELMTLLAIEALGLNYRLGMAEVGLLGLLNEGSPLQLAMHLTGFNEAVEVIRVVEERAAGSEGGEVEGLPFAAASLNSGGGGS